MPAREMRGRYLMREFWADVEIQSDLSDAERWTLVGLWMLADDGGFLAWDLRYIAAQLYNHEDRADREKKVSDHLKRIVEMKKAKVFACGHVFLPAAARYGRPGRRSDASNDVQREHEAEPSRKIRQRSGKNGQHSGRNTLPHLTLPNLTLPIPNSNSKSNQPRGRARGGAPAPIADEVGALKRKVGWEPGE